METYKLYTDMVKGMMFKLTESPNWRHEKQYCLRFPLIAKNGRLELYLRTRPDSYQTKVFVKRLNSNKPTKIAIDEAIKLLSEYWFAIDELTMYEMIAEHDGHEIRKKYIARMVVSEPESKPWIEKKGEPEMSKVYLVIFDGYMEDYGAYSYLLGAYDTKDKAEEAVKTLPVEVRDDEHYGDCRVAIQEIEVNKTYEIKKDEWGNYSTEWPTGGYAE